MIDEGTHFLLRSSISRKILECLGKHNKPMSPKQIAKEINVARDNVSTRILPLAEKEFVRCINPDARLWRFYIITSKGKRLLKEVNKLL